MKQKKKDKKEEEEEEEAIEVTHSPITWGLLQPGPPGDTPVCLRTCPLRGLQHKQCLLGTVHYVNAHHSISGLVYQGEHQKALQQNMEYQCWLTMRSHFIQLLECSEK